MHVDQVSQDKTIKSQLDQLEATVLNLSSESATQLAQLRQDILRDVKQLQQDSAGTDSIPPTIELKHGIGKVRRSLNALSSKIDAVRRESIILQNVFFSSMNLREEAIKDPESGTFKWMIEEESEESEEEYEEAPEEALEGALEEEFEEQFEEEERKELEQRSRSRILFSEWLRSGAGIFHISGKAGSGKSTLMKFLCHHDQTREELEKWAAGKQKTLVFSSFYFWSSRDDLQMSLAGLYRTILFEILRRCPDLIRVVFPRHWDQLTNGMVHIPGNLLSGPDITRAFETLTAHGTFPDYCFCFFIDGLDEYHGESEDHVQLAKTLRRWASKGDVKICASSRPHIEFDDLTGSPNQTFHLHELTRHDIRLFSRQMIEKSDKFDRIKDSYLQLVDKIVEMSQGVFLWARLVVSSLLAGMLGHDTTKTLEEKLKVIPKGIDELYDGILSSLEPYDRQRAAKLLLITVYKKLRMPLNCLAYGWIDSLDDPKFPPCDGRKSPSWRPANIMVEDVQRQLKFLTKGLLETTLCFGGGRSDEFAQMRVVQFFHRTVEDFVMNSSKLEDISRQYPRLLEEESYYRLLLADLTLGSLAYRRLYWNCFMIIDSSNASLFHQTLPSTLLDGFRHVLCDGRSESDESGDEVFRGVLLSIGSHYYTGRMSFIHMIAFAGQTEYVLREVSKRPELLRGNQEMHLLLTAALGGHKNLVTALLKRGSSPTDTIKIQREQNNHDSAGLQSIPLWLALAGCMVGNSLKYLKLSTSFDILELFLDADGVDAWNCAFLLKENSSWESPVSHYITLKGFVQGLVPRNKDRLISLIDKGKPGSTIGSITRFVSRLTSFYKPVEVLTPLGTAEFTFSNATGVKPRMFMAGVVYGGLNSDGYRLQLY